jgi:hypothetical protein
LPGDAGEPAIKIWLEISIIQVKLRRIEHRFLRFFPISQISKRKICGIIIKILPFCEICVICGSIFRIYGELAPVVPKVYTGPQLWKKDCMI